MRSILLQFYIKNFFFEKIILHNCINKNNIRIYIYNFYVVILKILYLKNFYFFKYINLDILKYKV